MATNNSWNNTITDAAVTINTGTNALSLSTDASATTVTIATGGAVKAVTLGSTNTTSSLTLQSGTGDLLISSQDELLIDGAGIVEINSSAGVISIGNDAVTENINIGTGAAARTITIGNGTDATSIVVDCGTGALNLGTNAIARTTTLGNLTGASVLALQYGTGDFTLASATGTIISALDTGEMIKPLQPAFYATSIVQQTNVTGAGTTVTVNFTSEIFDQNSDYDGTNTFTAPVTGRYILIWSMQMDQLDALATAGVMFLVTSNRQYNGFRGNYGALRNASDSIAVSQSTFADMDASDTAFVRLAVSNMGGDTVDTGASFSSYFCGYLAV